MSTLPVPTFRLFVLACVGLLPALAVAIARMMRWPYDGLPALAVCDAALLAVALLDALSRRRVAVQVERRCPPVLSIGRSNPVRLELLLRSAEPLDVTVTDSGAERVLPEGLPATVPLCPQHPVALRYTLHPQARGAHRLGSVWLRWPSRLGLWQQQQQRRDLGQEVRVFPDLLALRTYDVWVCQARAERMTRATRQPGGESEFERLREYSQDDDVRRIDWKATARRRTVMARQFQLERDQNVVIALEMGRWMTADSDGLPQFDRALNAALMVAHVATKMGDHTGLLAFDSQVRAWLPPQGGPGAIRRLIRASYDLQPSLDEADFRAAVGHLRRRLPKRSLVLLFTQVLDPERADELRVLLRALRPVHLPVVVMLRDEGIEALAQPAENADVAEAYVKGAAAAHLLERERLVEGMRRAGALVIDCRPAELTSRAVQRYLEVKSRQML